MKSTFLHNRSLILFLFFSLVQVGLFNHEIWRDEGQYINIAVELSFSEIFEISRIEGFFPIHQLFIKIFYLMTNDKILSLKLFNSFFFLIFLIVLRNCNKIPILILILLLCSHPILTNYSIISRHYVALLPSISYLIFYENKSKQYENLNISFLILTGTFGIIISGCYVLINFKRFYFNLINLKENKYLLVVLSTLLISLFFVLPFVDRDWNTLVLRDFDQSIKLIYSILYSINFLHPIDRIDSIWHELQVYYKHNYIINLYNGLYLLTVCSFLIFNKKFSDFAFFFLISFSLTSFFLIIALTGYRHYFFISVILNFILIKIFFIDNIERSFFKNKINFFVFLFFTTTLVTNAIFSISYFYKEIRYNFSNGILVAKYIKENNIKCSEVISFPSPQASSWTPYIKGDCKPYQVRYNLFSGFHQLRMNKLPGEHDNFEKELIPFIEKNKNKYFVVACKHGQLKDLENKPCQKEIKILINKKIAKKENITEFTTNTLNGYREKFFILNYE